MVCDKLSDMKTIKLPCYGIIVELEAGGGTIQSTLSDQAGGYPPYDVVESMVLAHACAGIDIESPAYIEGIETAIDAIANNTM